MLPLLSTLPTNSTCLSQCDRVNKGTQAWEIGGRGLGLSHAAI